MSIAQENIIRTRFKDKVANVLNVPVTYEGDPTYFLNDQPVPVPSTGIWLKFSMKMGDTVQRSFGDVSGQEEGTPGVMIIQVNCEAGTGDKDLRDAAETVRSKFRRIDLNGIVFRTPSKGNPRRRGKWWGLTVKCPFTLKEFTAPSEA